MFRSLVLIAILLSTLNAETKVGRFRCMLRDEPSTTFNIGWEQMSGINPIVYYGTEDHGVQYQRYSDKAYPNRTIMAKGMNNCFARLSKLRPNTVYYFVILDTEGVSKRYSFRTLPDDHMSRLSILGGGDSRNHRIARQNANKMVAKLRPHFVLFAGDMTGLDSSKEWQDWLDDWQMTISDEGRMTALIAARGNHERNDESIVDMFDVPNPDVYYALSFARGLLRVYTLNSMQSSNTYQAKWLEKDLSENMDMAWRMAQYHHPIRPHTRRKSEQEYLRMYWAPLFFKYSLQLALECDSHMSKITWPVRATNNRSESGYDEGFVQDPKGTVFVGEGGWGAPVRAADDGKKWTRAMGSFNQIKWFFVNLDKIEIRTIKTDNANEVSKLNDLNRFFMPDKIDLWKIDGLNHIDIINPKKENFKPREAQIVMEITKTNVKVLNDQVFINWSTAQEANRVKYKIQVSSNKIFWKTIEIIPAQGPDANRLRQYEFVDETSEKGGKLFYKIVAVDRSGKEICSNILEVRTLGKQNMEELTGDLSAGLLKVPLDVADPTRVKIDMYDIKRNVVFSKAYNADENTVYLSLNIRHLEKGFYLMEISYDGLLIKKSIRISG